MFGSNKKKEASRGGHMLPTTKSHSLNSLVKGTSIEGTINAESDIRIDGTIKGKLTCSAKVIIGPTGSVVGDIRCQNAVIEGNFEGNIFVSDLLNVREAAKINGEVRTKQLIVQPGAIFNVTCIMGESRSSDNRAIPSGKQSRKVVAATV